MRLSKLKLSKLTLSQLKLSQLRIIVPLLSLLVFFQNCGKFKSTGDAEAYASMICEAELMRAFENSFHVTLKAKCASCHVAGEQGNGVFASADVATAYMAFSLVTPEKVALYAVDPNHRAPYTGPENAAAIDQAKQDWQTAKQKTAECKAGGSMQYLTREKSIGDATQFVTMVWNLDSEMKQGGGGYRGAQFALEVRARPDVNGYQFRNPRITTGSSPIHLKGIRVVVNGQLMALGATYTALDQLVPANLIDAVLSPATLTISSAPKTSDTLAIQFDLLEAK